MDVTYLGKSGVRISGKTANLLIDPVDLPGNHKIKDEVVIITDPELKSKLSGEGHMLIDGAGEYEIKGALVVGLPAAQFGTDSEHPKGAVYRIEVDGFKLAAVGSIKGKLTDEQAGELGEVDVLILPVGGKDTLDPSGASEIISQLEPKYVVPVNYEKLDEFFKEIGSHPETQPKLKLNSKEAPLETTFVPLEVSA